MRLDLALRMHRDQLNARHDRRVRIRADFDPVAEFAR
jgi:hypothetical protein